MMTFDEIADAEGISKSLAFQIYNHAMNKLRQGNPKLVDALHEMCNELEHNRADHHCAQMAIRTTRKGAAA